MTKGIRVVVLIGALVFIGVLGLVGYFAAINIAFVDTLHARIEGPVIQVQAPAAARVLSFPLQVGDAVAANEELVILEALTSGTTQPVVRVIVPVRAPTAGVVAEKAVQVGDALSPGQPILSLVAPEQLWVTAYIHESRIPQIQIGQRVRIKIRMRAMQRTFWGQVEEISPATTAALAPQRLAASSPQPVEVPVRISIDPAGYALYPGMTAEVRIALQPQPRW